MRAVCIGRHRYLSDHFCAIFAPVGLDCHAATGVPEGMELARALRPDVVVCDYDLLVAAGLEDWEHDATLAGIPIVAVSLTRRPDEAQSLDGNGVAGFLYLPTLRPSDVECVMNAATAGGVRVPAHALQWHADRHHSLLD